MKPRIFLTASVLCTVIFLLFSCTDTETASEEAADTGILTNLYRETECVLPEGWWMLSSFPPEYDAENDTFTVCAQFSEEDEQENGTILYNYTVGFFTLDQNGSVISQVTEPLPEHTQITHGLFTDDAVYCVTNLNTGEAERKHHLHRYDRETGETISTAELTYLLDTGMNFPYALCTDVDGDIYLASQEKIVILRPDLTEIVSIPMKNYLRSMASDRDGTVRVSTALNGSQCIAAVNKDSGTLDSAIPFEQTPTLLHMQPSDPDHIFYYLTDTFVWGMTFDEDGKPVPEAVMDLVNSGISNTNAASGASGVSSPTAVLDRDTILFAYAGVPLLYCHTDNIDLDTIRTITVAYSEPPNAHIMTQILEFNKDHSDVRVVTKDYSSYTTDDKPNGAEEQLTLEITTGLFRPDIVLGDTGSLVLEQIFKNNLYTDLTPYLETDDTVNFDTLYGCIPRTFDDGKGGMWAIASEFDISTLIARSDVLGNYAVQTSWTLDEMLDFLESLPDDVEKYPQTFRTAGMYAFLAQGYGYFIDRETGTCSFDSELFVRYLNFLMTLPADSREWRARSDYASMSAPDQFHARMSGKVALDMIWLGYPDDYWELESSFGTKDYTLIGRATTTDSGARITSDHVFAITSFTESPATCWELLKYFFAEKHPALLPESGILALKTTMAAELIPSEEYDRVHYTTGVTHAIERDPDNPLTEETLDKPGIILTFTDEDRMKYEDFLDRSGNPLIHEIPDAVTDIVKEELSVLFGGLGTAEDCAKKIQSRVTIWLSENE
ncbi:MAG: extracellular solute-binding protein [Clostridia bacterium]|nr:extracellular solute-binding protein [Clostridia bacterium]